MQDINNPTTEQIAKHYSAAMDSVTLINKLVAAGTLSDADKATIGRNVAHLELMVAKTYWTTQDLKPLRDAITAGNAAVA